MPNPLGAWLHSRADRGTFRSLTKRQYREKVERLLGVLHGLKNDEMLFFIDELGPVRVKKHGGRSYVQKGRSKKVPQIQANKGSVCLAGALSATTNQVTWFYCEAKDTKAMIDLAEILFNQCRDKSKLYVAWDAASWHGSAELVDWLDEFNRETRGHKLGLQSSWSLCQATHNSSTS